MKKSRLNRLIPVFLLFIIDRVTKHYFYSHFSLGESKEVWGDKLRLTLVFNKGAAFGSMQNSGWILLIISAIALVALIFLLLNSKISDKIILTGLILVISGALGNLFDRIIHGHVIDFIDVDIPDIVQSLPRWPVFNVADSCITVGIILIILRTLLKKEDKEHAPDSV